MIRTGKFLISQRPYAVDLGSLRTYGKVTTIDAVWFRRRRNRTVASVGTLRDFQEDQLTDPVEFLRHFTDGRHGGHCAGRWDGSGYWGSEDPAVAARHLDLLRPMLDGYPGIPAGYDGWWRFL